MLVAQSRPTLCDPMDCSPPGSSVHGILQARILEWVTTSFSRGTSQPMSWSQSPARQADSLSSETPGSEVKVALVVSDSLQPYQLYSPWNSPGQNSGVDSLSLLQRIQTQGSNPGLPHCRQILYQLRYKGSPRILEWIACPFSSRSSWPRKQTGVSCIAGKVFTNWAIREALQGSLWFSSVQLLSHVWLFATPWTVERQASLSITNSLSLLKLMSIASAMPCNHLILCHPLLLPPSIFPRIRVFSNESVLHIRWPKYWSFSFSISPSNEYLGLISFRMEWLEINPYHYFKVFIYLKKKKNSRI